MKTKKKRVFVALNKCNNGEILEFANYEEFTDQTFRQCVITYDEDGYPTTQSPLKFIDKYDLSIWSQAVLCKWTEGSRGPYLAELELLPELGHLEDIFKHKGVKNG